MVGGEQGWSCGGAMGGVGWEVNRDRRTYDCVRWSQEKVSQECQADGEVRPEEREGPAVCTQS